MSQKPQTTTKDLHMEQLQSSSSIEIAQNAHKQFQPLSFLHPTGKRYDVLHAPGGKSDAGLSTDEDDEKVKVPTGAQMEWRSRDNRKGRHVLVLSRSEAPARIVRAKKVLSAIWRMCTVMAWWDVSWWIAINFTFGSCLFLMSGVFYWMPTAYPDRHYTFSALVAGGVTSAIGGTLFAVGGVLLVVEAVNAEQSGCFGWALEHMGNGSKASGLETERSSSSGDDEKAVGVSQVVRFRPKMEHCRHHHQRRNQPNAEIPQPTAAQPWIWWPSHHELKTHYIFEIGFLANFIMFIGATIFWVTSILSLPGVFNNMSQGVLWGVYYVTYLVGSIFFVVSSALYIIEAQTKWYLPAPSNVGWWIAIFNMLGSIGWLFAACLGYCTDSWCAYQADLTLIWASAAFLIASALLWYEAIEKYPVRVDKKQ
ncbi:MAG: hypothetical protein M1828_005122 [Chrysothrix sp. TS-e1954]|nr:MAG: hypothetical protein M1828_005122 [Chrysothrix sp. TS-e1954]